METMTASSPSFNPNYPIYDDWDASVDGNPFDLYAPTSRQWTTGAFPIKSFQAQNGAEIRILYGNTLTGKKMTLTYANVTNDVAEHFIRHYVAMRGSFTQFVFDDTNQDGVRAGWDLDPNDDSVTKPGVGARSWGMKWRYAEEPQIQAVYRGVSTITINLIAVPNPS
jgi:hypothetical protein